MTEWKEKLRHGYHYFRSQPDVQATYALASVVREVGTEVAAVLESLGKDVFNLTLEIRKLRGDIIENAPTRRQKR